MLPSIPSHAQYQSFGAFFDVVTGASRVGTACASLACPDAVTLRFGRANTLRTYRTRSLRHPQATQNRPPLVTAPVDILHSFTYPHSLRDAAHKTSHQLTLLLLNTPQRHGQHDAQG